MAGPSTKRVWRGVGTSSSAVAAVAVAVAVAIFIAIGSTPELWVDRPAPKADSIRWRLGVTLADTALVFLAAALMIGPIRVLRGGRPAVHLPVRRRVGVVAGVTGLAHLVVGLSVHGDLSEPWRSFVTGWPSRSDPIPITISYLVLANWVGLALALVLVVLVATSNPSTMRRLRAVRWKRVQRLAYLAVAAVAVHAVFYQRVEQRWLPHRVATLGLVALVVVLQCAALVRVRRAALSPLARPTARAERSPRARRPATPLRPGRRHGDDSERAQPQHPGNQEDS
jgi:sulfoxide reductase heme-binding subunit YedZ